MLKNIHEGKIQLPDFQRGWVWDDNRIKGILASVAKSFPIGAVMLLETGNNSIRFKTKVVEGAPESNGVKPELLILDGQQRLTSLYQSIISNRVVKTRNSKGYEIKRWYYIDMQKALDPATDLEEAIFSINENKIITKNIGRDIVLDLSTRELEYENLMYPVWMVDEYSDWRRGFNRHWNHSSDKSELWDEFEELIINSFNHYMLPVIEMKKTNPKEAVCQVFEKVNTGGVSLSVFELLTASFASDDFDLKEDWAKIESKFKPYKVLSKTSEIDFIQALTLFSTYRKKVGLESSGEKDNLPAVSAKRKEMLNLEIKDYIKYRDQITEGFIKTSKILNENHIFNSRDVPYLNQLVPMAAIITQLDKNIENVGNKNKLMQWYWCGVFGELYGSANETRYALDIVQVVEWILNNGEVPKTIFDANFIPSRLNTLRTRNSAAYKGIYAILMDDNTRDWLSGTKIDFSTYFSESIDIHHIFPVAWCEKNTIPRDDYNSIINKTPLSGRTNRIVSGDAPSKYLDRLKNNVGVSDEEFLDILKSHVVNPDYLYQDDFYAFFNDRKERILQKMEIAMGKVIVREYEALEEGEYLSEEDEFDEYDENVQLELSL
ncbi:MAG: DUF262 domain-containing protein [Fermentimonas sp.]|nr:DUF262 domain-containing protein [Fermentimonas sp.]